MARQLYQFQTGMINDVLEKLGWLLQLLFIHLSSLARIWLTLSIWGFNLNWHVFWLKKKKSTKCSFRARYICVWGKVERERTSRLGHFVSPLLTSVTGTRGVGGAIRRFSHEPRGGDRRWLSHRRALYLGVFVNLLLHFILTNPSVAHRNGFSSHVFLMKEPKLRENKWHAGDPSQAAAKSLGPLRSHPGAFALNQLFPRAGCSGQGLSNFLPWRSVMSRLHLWNKGNPDVFFLRAVFWKVYSSLFSRVLI